MTATKDRRTRAAESKAPIRATTRRDHEGAVALLTGVADLDAAAAAGNLDDARSRIQAVQRALLEAVGPVRVSAAAEILGLSPKTVRAWLATGLLAPAENPGTTRTVLDPERLYEVAALVRDLRAAGRDRNLIDAVWYRLQDRQLRAEPQLDEALEQVRRGEGREWREGPDGSWGPAE